jgi:2'-5' RNA ligase
MMLRTFIAVEIPPDIQGLIAEQSAALKNRLPKAVIRWVTPNNVHLTIKFLGDLTPTALEQVAESLKEEAASHEPFSMSVRGLGAFPSPRRPRVIWIGLEAPAALEALVHGVEAALARLGFPAEQRPFSPHLTIGRVAQNVSLMDVQNLQSALESTRVGLLGKVRVEAVHIFKSDLRPGGAVYTHLYALAMK